MRSQSCDLVTFLLTYTGFLLFALLYKSKCLRAEAPLF